MTTTCFGSAPGVEHVACEVRDRWMKFNFGDDTSDDNDDAADDNDFKNVEVPETKI